MISRGSGPVPVLPMTTDWHKEEGNMPSHPGHQYDPLITHPPFISQQREPNFHPLPGVMPQSGVHLTGVGTMLPDLVSLTPRRNLSTSPVTVHQDPGTSRDRPRKQWELNKELIPAPITPDPAQSNRSTCMRKAPRRRYLCEDCDKEYAQLQGLNRHQRETHEPEICIYCGTFEWGRLYIFRKHLKDKHPELNTDTALETATGTRRGAFITSRRSTPRPISPSGVEHEVWRLSDLPADASPHVKSRNIKTRARRPLQRVGVTCRDGLHGVIKEAPYTS
jgi:hypothetical protein